MSFKRLEKAEPDCIVCRDRNRSPYSLPVHIGKLEDRRDIVIDPIDRLDPGMVLSVNALHESAGPDQRSAEDKQPCQAAKHTAEVFPRIAVPMDQSPGCSQTEARIDRQKITVVLDEAGAHEQEKQRRPEQGQQQTFPKSRF